MQITLNIPDRLISQLTDNPDTLPQRILEAFTRQAYAQGTINLATVAQLLGLSSPQEITHFLNPSQPDLQAPATDKDLNPENFTLSFHQNFNGNTLPTSEPWPDTTDELSDLSNPGHHSLAVALCQIPDVGEDSDFERIQDEPVPNVFT